MAFLAKGVKYRSEPVRAFLIRGISLSILIVSGLLLIAARDGKAQPSATTSKPPAVQSHKPTTDHNENINERYPPEVVKWEIEILEALRAITHEQQTARRENQANEKRWWPPSPSWAIVYVTVGYVFVAILQWGVIRRQADTLRAIEDAWISINFEPRYFPPPNRAHHPHIKYWFENAGRTPATIVEVCAILEFAHQLPDIPIYPPKAVIAYPENTSVVGPNLGKTTPGWCPIKPEDWEKAIDLALTWFFYGFIRYKPVYGPNIVSGFAFRFDRKTEGFMMIDNPRYTYRRTKKQRWFHRS